MAEDVISWRAMPQRAPVLDAAGNQIGTVATVIADDDKDIFHGIAVKLRHGGTVEIAAARIPRITRQHVETNVPPDQVEGLPEWRS